MEFLGYRGRKTLQKIIILHEISATKESYTS